MTRFPLALSTLLFSALPALAFAQDAEPTDDAAPAEEVTPVEEETAEEAAPAEEETVVDEAMDAVVEEATPVVEDEMTSRIDGAGDTLLEAAASNGVQYQVTLPRVWAISVPSGGLDLFFSRHANTWEDGQANLAFGAEFIFRQPHESDTVISFDYTNLQTPDDYWLEDGDPIRDADWTVNSLRLLTLDVSHHWITDLDAGGAWQLYYGMGLGVSFVLGEVLKYNVRPGCLNGNGGSEDVDLLDACIDDSGEGQYDLASEEREEKIWPVLPSLNLTLGSRYYITDNIVGGVELGWKGIYMFGGVEFGYVF